MPLKEREDLDVPLEKIVHRILKASRSVCNKAEKKFNQYCRRALQVSGVTGIRVIIDDSFGKKYFDGLREEVLNYCDYFIIFSMEEIAAGPLIDFMSQLLIADDQGQPISFDFRCAAVSFITRIPKSRIKYLHKKFSKLNILLLI